MNKKSYLIALSSLTLALGSAQAADSQQTATLLQLVKQQHTQLERENAQLRLQGQQIAALTQRVQSDEKSSASAPVTNSPTKFSAKVYTAQAQHSVLKQASSASKGLSIPASKLVLGSEDANLSIYGQINQLGFYENDGDKGKAFFGTNSNSDTRLDIDSIKRLKNNNAIGSHLELGFDNSPSNAISQNTTNTQSIDTRVAEIYYQSNWGKVLLGKGKTASDDTANSDLSGTSIIARSSVGDIGGGLFFYNRGTETINGSPIVSNVFNNFDGFSRKNRFRYDTPVYHGFSASASEIEGSDRDVALHYANQFGQTKFVAQMAYNVKTNI